MVRDSWKVKLKDSLDIRDYFRYELMEEMLSAQNNLRAVWMDKLPRPSEGFGQMDVVPWALEQMYLEEFRVNGRSRLLLTTNGRRYIESEIKILTALFESEGV